MKRILIALALLALCALPAHAQKTIPTLTTEINTNFPDNTTGAITPQILRTTTIDMLSVNQQRIDVFLAIGASNTVGQGTSASAPIPQSTALAYCANGTIVTLADPVCSAVTAAQNANTGSMWPAFGIAYNRPVGIVQTAVSGSTQATACDFGAGAGNWEATGGGTNFANSITAINAALTAFAAAGYTPTFRGLIINDLGGNDGLQINSSVCTAAQYSAGYVAMAANYRAATIGGTTYPHMPIYASLVGTDSDPGISDSGLAQVRAKQIANAGTDGNLLIVFDDLASFNARGMMQVNSAHFTQTGYNTWGYNVGGSILPYVPLHDVKFMTINNNTGAVPLPIDAGTVFQLQAADTQPSRYEVISFGNQPAGLLRCAGGTNASPSGLTSGTFCGFYNVKAFGSTVWPSSNQGAIGWKATENQTDTAHGMAAVIFCTPNTTVTPKACGTFDQNGNLNLGLAGTYTAALNLSGATSGVVTAQVQAAAGTYNWNYPTSAGSSGQPLLSGGGGASAMTFGTLGIAGGGTGVTTGTPWLESTPITVDFSVAGDNAITVPLPSGFTRLAFCGVIISGASADISAANFGVFTTTGGGGGAMITAGTAITVTATADNTNNNAQVTNCANSNTESYTPNSGTVQFRVGTTAAAGRTAKVTLRYNPIP